MNDEDVKKHFIDKYGFDKYKAKMEQALKLREQGITDQSSIDSAIDLMDDNGISAREAGAVMRFRKGLEKNDVINNPDQIRQMAKQTGISDENADRVVDLVAQTFKLKGSRPSQQTKIENTPHTREEVNLSDHKEAQEALKNTEQLLRGVTVKQATEKTKEQRPIEKTNSTQQRIILTNREVTIKKTRTKDIPTTKGDNLITDNKGNNN